MSTPKIPLVPTALPVTFLRPTPWLCLLQCILKTHDWGRKGTSKARTESKAPEPSIPPRHPSWRCRAEGHQGAALTHDGVLSLKQGSPLAQPHGAAHLPRIVFWHVYDLEKGKQACSPHSASVRQTTALHDMSLEAPIPQPFLLRGVCHGRNAPINHSNLHWGG